MADLKRISSDGVGVALDKANHYRLLNEPQLAESICLDVLDVEPGNQRALITLLLSLTDQFPTRHHTAHQRAESILPQLNREYDRLYYEGIIHERWGSTLIDQGVAPGHAPEWLSKAMRCFEQAEKLSEGKNPDPILRWNTCARLIDSVHQDEIEPPSLTRDIESEFGVDDVPY